MYCIAKEDDRLRNEKEDKILYQYHRNAKTVKPVNIAKKCQMKNFISV